MDEIRNRGVLIIRGGVSVKVCPDISAGTVRSRCTASIGLERIYSRVCVCQQEPRERLYPVQKFSYKYYLTTYLQDSQKTTFKFMKFTIRKSKRRPELTRLLRKHRNSSYLNSGILRIPRVKLVCQRRSRTLTDCAFVSPEMPNLPLVPISMEVLSSAGRTKALGASSVTYSKEAVAGRCTTHTMHRRV